MELLCLEKENEPCSVADPVFLDDDRVLTNLLFLESKYRLKESYLETVQKDLTAAMRKEVAIWLLEVRIFFCLKQLFNQIDQKLDQKLNSFQLHTSTGLHGRAMWRGGLSDRTVHYGSFSKSSSNSKIAASTAGHHLSAVEFKTGPEQNHHHRSSGDVHRLLSYRRGSEGEFSFRKAL